MKPAKRILYIQYANSAGYPPLHHGTRILAREGWKVVVLGVQSPGMEPLEWPRIEGVDFRLLRGTPRGLLLKLQYVAFAAWALASALRWRPAVVYASDPLATPVAWLVKRVLGCRLVYHEHDAPPWGAGPRAVARCRRRAARSADLCVVPNRGRAEAFAAETGVALVRISCVWNCPSREEVREADDSPRADFVVYFHGNVSAALLPFAVLDAIAALPRHVRLEFAGYETIGSRGHVERFMRHAEHLGLDAARVKYLGAGSRSRVLEWASRCDAGLALMPTGSSDINMRFMVGASNKPFDYLAAGLALVVSNLRDWEGAFVKPGYAVSCDPTDGRSIAAALAPLVEDSSRRRAMARAARERIKTDWNYEHQFAPVLERLRAWAQAA